MKWLVQSIWLYLKIQAATELKLFCWNRWIFFLQYTESVITKSNYWSVYYKLFIRAHYFSNSCDLTFFNQNIFPSCSDISDDVFTAARSGQPVTHMSSTNSKPRPSNHPIKPCPALFFLFFFPMKCAYILDTEENENEIKKMKIMK